MLVHGVCMNSQQTKNILFLSLSSFIFILLVSPYFVFAQTSSQPVSTLDLQTQIQNLLKQIQALQQQVATLQAELGKEPEKTSPAGETPPTSSVEASVSEPEAVPPELTRPLSRGSSGDDVRKLQEFLAKDKEIYPDGLITGFFGPLTEAAVKKWQEKHGIESIGIIGPKSIAKLKDLGKYRIQQLLEQGAGASGNIPPGLLIAPGIQKKVEATATTAPTVVATSTPSTATTTPSGTIPAVPATPAQPTSGTGTATVPATPATPATPAQSTSSDTTVPSTPTNLSVTAPSTQGIILSWTSSTDNVGVTGYRIYRGGVQIATVATSTFYSDASLSASTAYSYTVAAYDAAGNVSEQSTAVSATTLSAGPPAPTNVQAVTTSGSQSDPPQMWYYLVFNYTLQSTTQSFNIYRKRPTDASFVKYTYSAQMPVNPSILPLPASNESNLYRRESNQWSWYTTLTGLAPDIVQGEYKFYVTAVDTSGVESIPSETKSFKLYAPPVITSPAEGSTVSAPFTITFSGDPNAPSPTYSMALYKNTTGGTVWSGPAPSTSFTYGGPALNPSDNPHRLVMWFSSGIYDRSLFGTSIFNISTTTSTTTSYLDLRAKNLAAISQSLDEIKEKLLKLLQEL